MTGRPCSSPGTVCLSDSTDPTQGHVTVGGRHVCDDGWDISDARVVCKSLGFSDATAYRRSAQFGEGSGKIWLDDVACTGEESNLEECSHLGWESHNCGHREDAGVECGECPGNYKPF